MLDFMRQKKTSVVSYFIFGIIIIVFAISFGPGATNPGGTVQGVVATVGDKSITEMEYKASYSLAFQRYKSMFPGFDSDMAKSFNWLKFAEK